MKHLHQLLATVLLTLTLASQAADGPYNEAADAKQDIQHALTQSRADGKPLLVVFGANWCGDCKVLDLAMKSGATAALMARDFRVVKVDVARFTKNVDIAESYGVPLKKGIPAVALLGADQRVIYATRAGELADARTMGDAGIHDFFQRALAESGVRR